MMNRTDAQKPCGRPATLGGRVRWLFRWPHLVVIALSVGAALSGCITRTEVEAYTVTHRDTTITDAVRNAPGERDNGVIYPSSREEHVDRGIVSRDSIHERYYPDFLRFGGIELAGFIGTGNGSSSYWGGLFGAYGQLDSSTFKVKRSHTFSGGLIRLVPAEFRLRWFHDAPNWSFGFAFAEAIFPGADPNLTLVSIFPVYVRKRFFLRREVPYVMVQPTVGVGWLPWQYINLGATLDVGSFGGMNVHAYAGYAAGTRMKLSASVESATSSFPYAGIGVSVLDFVNTVDETKHEWNVYKHRSLEVGMLTLDFIHAFDGRLSFFDKTKPLFMTGAHLRFANVAYPLWPVNKHLYAGTTLFSALVMGNKSGAMSVLPLRVGWHVAVAPEELTNETFVELNYYPSGYIHIGDRLCLDISALTLPSTTLSVTIGYVAGSTNDAVGYPGVRNLVSIDGLYLAIGFGLSDAIFNVNSLVPW